jgi:mannose-6-phosphate isomerase-like protein (cupin superfamily)
MMLDPKASSLDTGLKVLAPDGSEVTILTVTERGSMAQFRLAPACVSLAVQHHSVEEIWAIQQGTGRIWLARDGDEQVVDLSPGVTFTIPVGAAFQFRNDGDDDLLALAVTMPPWPGEGEATLVSGPWDAILQA